MKQITQIMVMLLCAFYLISCKSPTGPGGDPLPTQPPSAPLGVSASQCSLDYITVSWNASNGAEGYKIYRSSSSTSYSLIETTSSTSWTDNSTTKAKWYTYVVKAYNKAGESAGSNSVSGYRVGFRFENVKYYIPTSGIGFNFDLNAFGLKNAAKTIVLYAVYKNGSNYYYVPSAPGTGLFNSVAIKYLYTPSTNAEVWTHQLVLQNIWWNSGYKNNTYPQYIAMKVYQSQNIITLNDATFEQTTYYAIVWSKAIPIIIKELSPKESIIIDSQLRKNEISINN